jgi:branched-subunit amino acid transport protein
MTNQFLAPRLDTRIPSWMVWVQAVMFSILYAIWDLPATILVRNTCLITGALLSFWIIYQFRTAFFQRRAIAVWLIVALFAWACFHLVFLSNDFAAQYQEFTSIWKRTALGAIFALGFGIALSCYSQKQDSNGKTLWALIYLGLLAPTLIFIVKYVLTNYGVQQGWAVPDYWKLYYSSLPFTVPKIAYVCFCLPTLAIALGLLARNFHRGQIFKWANFFYLATIPAVLFVFYADNIKNGVVYSLVLMALFAAVLIFNNFRQHWHLKLVVLGLVLAIGGLLVVNSLQKNDSWRTFRADAKIALDTQTYQNWKYNGEKGYPTNELEIQVSGTNYERLAWVTVGIQLITQNPLGYGLIERSFGHLAKMNWPDSKLHQSHSGWIDLMLGIGIPGVTVIMTTLLILLYQLSGLVKTISANQDPYSTMVWWVLLSLLIMWCTTEISQKVYFDDLIFWLLLGAGLYLGYSHQSTSQAQIKA